MPGPLEGVRVVEFAGLGPGPFCAMLLADMGAEVLRIARPGTPVDAQDITTRSRSQVEIDLRGEEGQASALALIARADLLDRKSTRLNSSHGYISYAVFCLKKKKTTKLKKQTHTVSRSDNRSSVSHWRY